MQRTSTKRGLFTRPNVDDLLKKSDREKENRYVFPIIKTLAYLRQVLRLLNSGEISELPAGRGIVIMPCSSRQPQNNFTATLQEKIILTVTGEIFAAQGEVSEAKAILIRLIETINQTTHWIEEDCFGSQTKKLQMLIDVAYHIYHARQAILESFPASPNRNKLNTYLRTLEVNLRQYDFLQKAGVHYLGRDEFYADESSEEKLTKEKLASIDSISAQQTNINNTTLYTLLRKGRVKGYASVGDDGSRYIPEKELALFLRDNGIAVNKNTQAVDSQETKKLLWLRLMTQEFADVDGMHKIWVNSAPSNNPYAHELLVLCAGGHVKGYAHIDAFHDVLTYIPRDEFNDFLLKDNRTVMGLQPLSMSDVQASKNKLNEYLQRKWMAAGFIHNCADFTDEVAHAGGVPYSKLNPGLIGDYHHVQYPIKRLSDLAEIEETEEKLQGYVNKAKDKFREQADKAGIPESRQKAYVRVRHREGLPHEKAQYMSCPASTKSLFCLFGKIKEEPSAKPCQKSDFLLSLGK